MSPPNNRSLLNQSITTLEESTVPPPEEQTSEVHLPGAPKRKSTDQPQQQSKKPLLEPLPTPKSPPVLHFKHPEDLPNPRILAEMAAPLQQMNPTTDQFARATDQELPHVGNPKALGQTEESSQQEAEEEEEIPAPNSPLIDVGEEVTQPAKSVTLSPGQVDTNLPPGPVTAIRGTDD